MRLFLASTLLAAATLRAQSCPNVDANAGYPISATSPTGGADSAWLASVVRSAAYRWKVPSRRRSSYTGWERVTRRLLPPEPRWADDWSPEARHKAVVRLVVGRDQRSLRAEVVSPAGDKLFDQSLQSIARDPMPVSPPIPPAPAGVDSAVVLLSFGEVPAPNAPVIRFAVVQTRGELLRGTLNVVPPRGSSGPFPRLTVKYDVTADGLVDHASVEFVTAASSEYQDAVRDGLLGARFIAPQSNCRPIAQTMVQMFGR